MSRLASIPAMKAVKLVNGKEYRESGAKYMPDPVRSRIEAEFLERYEIHAVFT